MTRVNELLDQCARRYQSMGCTFHVEETSREIRLYAKERNGYLRYELTVHINPMMNSEAQLIIALEGALSLAR